MELFIRNHHGQWLYFFRNRAVGDEGVFTFPNPATGEVKFQQEDLPFGALFTLYDAHSNLMVKVSNPTTKTILFNADYFSSGMYFYNFVTSSGSLYSGKVIILH
ncbi:MAG: T9SS type A sorting domain-containing protein [Bacteroidetes bacterium]|nr:T9SS type A sorting domain-containing protein [Bacteroidota bacterium]